jgi:sugar-specific transcriptional regulator TrmB
MNKEILKEAGLNNNEIEVYLALTKYGSIAVSKISQITNLHRSNLYDTLEKLHNKGLVSHVITNNVKHYQATKPSRLIGYFEERLDNVKGIIPELEGLSKLPKEETVVELFKGKEGIKSVFKDILDEGKENWVCGAAEKFEELLPIFSKQYLRQINEKKMVEKIIFEEGTKVDIETNKGEYKFLSKEHDVPTSFNVYGDKVALFIWNTPMFAILIKSPEIAKTYKKYFEFLWGLSK